MRLIQRIFNTCLLIGFLWLIVVIFGRQSFLAASLDTLYTFYASYGFWPFDPNLIYTSILSGALLNPVFLLHFFGLTILFVLIFWHAFYFGYLLLSSIGSGKTLPDYFPSISVLLPALNEEQYIGGTLEALLKSDYSMDKLEIIVITSGSTDRTTEIAKRYETNGPVKVLTKPLAKKGKPAALELGLSQAKNEVIAIYDAETRVEPGTLRHLVKPLQLPNVVAVQGTTQVSNPGANKLTRGQALENAIFHGGGIYQEIYHKRNRPFWLLGRNYCVRRDLLLQLGGYKGNALTEDIRITFEIALQEGRIAFARRARAWEEAPDNWEAIRTQRLRWAGGWNIENKRFLEKTPNKRKAIFNMIDFIFVSNGIGFYPVLGTILGVIAFLLGDWIIAMMFFLPALFCILLQIVAAARYAKRPGLVTSFITLFRLFAMMLKIASKTPEISEWEKTEKSAANSTPAEKLVS